MKVTTRADASTIRRHHRVVARLLDHAASALSAGDLEATVNGVELAARYAWSNHPGQFSSPRAEDILRAAGRRLLASGALSKTRPTRRSHAPRVASVLHVLTEAHTLGGHTRLVSRWAGLDAGRAHSVIITSGGRAVPQGLIDATTSTGGRVDVLPTGPGCLVERVRQFDDAVNRADVVILHTHPYDPLPVVNLSVHDDARVLLLNHADHVFWLGGSIINAIAHLREGGAEVTRSRRGIQPATAVWLPVPLVQPNATSRDASRAQLGLRGDDVLAVTVASEYKFGPIDRYHYRSLLEPILARLPDLVVRVVGPRSADSWTIGPHDRPQMSALGEVLDVDTILAAADLYIDSYPFGSLTSMLEAGLHRLPLVSFWPYGEFATGLAVDLPGLDGVLHRASTPADFHAEIERLVRDARGRAEDGRRAQSAILRRHTGADWQGYVEAAYDATLAPRSGLEEVPPETSIFDQLLLRLNRRAPWPHDLWELVDQQQRDGALPSSIRRRARLHRAVARRLPESGRLLQRPLDALLLRRDWTRTPG